MFYLDIIFENNNVAQLEKLIIALHQEKTKFLRLSKELIRNIALDEFKSKFKNIEVTNTIGITGGEHNVSVLFRTSETSVLSLPAKYIMKNKNHKIFIFFTQEKKSGFINIIVHASLKPEEFKPKRFKRQAKRVLLKTDSLKKFIS